MTRGHLVRATAASLLVGLTAASDEAPLLEAGGRVVVLTGLPGDVESEADYERQLGRLLALFADPARRPERLVVLADAPEAVRVPGGLTAEVLPATRQAFLGLAASGAGGEPLVVIAWGHGGAQGTTPVFHVRGPRLQAEDFRALAAQAGRSRWLLYFRGSGVFARALRGPGRQVLSSEAATSFRSDPVGLGVVLEALEADPAASLPQLAARVGPATARWYESRHLARQEEPALWLDGEEPRLPARDVAARSDPTSGGPPAPEVPVPEPSPGISSRTEPSEAWRGLERADPERHPGADAVVLKSRSLHVLGTSPAIASESEEFIQVLTAEGERHGDFEVAFAPPFEDVTFLDLEVLRPDGTLLRLDPEEVRQASAGAPGYEAGAYKVFSLPGVEPGAVLRVHARRQWKTFPLPHVFLELPLADELPVVEATVEARVPLQSSLRWALRQQAPQEPEVAETRYGRTYTWRFRSLEPPPLEALAHPVRTPSLLLSTFPDWEAFAAWYRGLIREADQVTPEIVATARELTREARTDRERVAAVYDFVARLRYVAVPIGVNSHRPHSAGSVLRNKYGDCKDKANLFNTLLKVLGIQADLVLVPRFTQAHDATPGLAFNHAISRVTLGAEVLWVDTTDDVCRFGLLPPGDPGRKVLVIDGSRALVDLPRPDPSEHRIRLMTRLDAGAEASGALPARLEALGTGFADYELRSAARSVGRAAQPVLAESLGPSAGLFALDSQSHTPVAALGEEFAWRGEGSFHGLLVPVPGRDGGSRLLRAPFWLPREWDLALHRRRSPLFLNQGYPLVLEQTLEVTLAASAEVLPLPAAAAGEADPLRWRLAWSRGDGTRLVGRLDLRLASGELTWEETLAFQGQLRALQAALAGGPAYTVRN